MASLNAQHNDNNVTYTYNNNNNNNLKNHNNNNNFRLDNNSNNVNICKVHKLPTGEYAYTHVWEVRNTQIPLQSYERYQHCSLQQHHKVLSSSLRTLQQPLQLHDDRNTPNYDEQQKNIFRSQQQLNNSSQFSTLPESCFDGDCDENNSLNGACCVKNDGGTASYPKGLDLNEECPIFNERFLNNSTRQENSYNSLPQKSQSNKHNNITIKSAAKPSNDFSTNLCTFKPLSKPTITPPFQF